jgi:hypothetical protein
MKRKLINIFIYCIISICCNAQVEGYRFYAALDSIKTSGFYNIVLSPEINAHLKKDYSDVRIVNTVGKWVSHALHVPAYEITSHSANLDLKYSVLENNRANSIFIINGKDEKLNNIELSIRNSSAERYCSLSGSDDNKNWFVINDSILINPIPSDTKSKNTFNINFPLNDYNFYRLVIFNSNKDPYDVIGITSIAKIEDSGVFKSKVLVNPSPIISQKDSNKISYIKITQQHPYHFDGFNIKVSGVKYYSRNADIFIPTNPNHSFSNPGKLLQSFTISNNSNLNFHLPLLSINDSIFYLLVHNEDNLPLKINEVSTTINEHILKTYLEAGNSYRLIMGNGKAVEPIYDFAKLSFSFRDTATFLTIKNISAFPLQEKTEVKKETNNKWIIWTALLAGLFILLLLTKKMIKEVDKKTTNDTI